MIFDGYREAQKREIQLHQQLTLLEQQGVVLKIAAILFKEDLGSVLYTRLKSEAAKRVGIVYEIHEFSLLDNISDIKELIDKLNADPTVTGIIIQKPWTRTWIKNFVEQEKNVSTADFSQWWQELVTTLSLGKDVDGLHPETLLSVQQGSWSEKGQVLPATCRAVLSILELALGETEVQNKLRLSPTVSVFDLFSQLKFVIIGRSDLLGKPLFYELINKKCEVINIGKKELNELNEQKKFLSDFDVIVTATGVSNLILGNMVKENAIVIDAGEPLGDVYFASVSPKASFITPVPGGVGPMTVVSLLENCVNLFKHQ